MFNSNASEMPTDLPWQLLEEITNGFSEERKIGSGGYGVVYKGVYKNEEIAVKKLYHMPGLDDQQFQNELQNLTRLRHQNIVRLVGRSYEERDRCVEYKGKLVCAKMIDRVICLEYLHNGSLEKYLCDESSGLPWHWRYKIIKGICDGLRYLHGYRIFHLDLKPANILLDKNMVPKIADFGLSRLFSGTRQSHTASKFLGTFGYMPPEYIDKGKISDKFDVFSLGVIITGIMTGPNGYSKYSEMSSRDFIEQVLGNWRNRLQEQWKDKSSLDVFCQQVKICIEIALNCVETDRHKRPSMGDIICKLNESETMIEKSYKIERKDQNVIKRKENWLQPSQLASYPLALSLALSKIGTTLGEEATKAVITKLSEKVTNLKELPAKVEEIKNELKTMNNVIRPIGTAYLTDEVVKGWIAEVRELAFHVEDVMDKYSYYALKLQEEGFLMKFVKGSHYVMVFSGIADEIIQIERKVQNVIKRKENWLQPSQLASNPLADIERHRSQDCFPELVKDEDLVGIEDNRRLLTKWLYTNEPGSTVITVSGMGGLGKTTLVTNVFDREKLNFPVNAWIVVSQTYTVDGLLRKLLQKIGYTEPPLSAKMDKMDVHDLKEEIKRQLKDTKCMVVLDDVWDTEAYIQMRDALQNLQASRIIITTRKKHVAALAPPTRCLELKPLNSTDGLELLCRRAFLNNRDHVCPPELDKLGKDIVDRCEGLPLAIVSIGGLLSSLPPTSYVWNEMYNQLRSELVNNNNVRAIINLSYHDLPGDLRNCFLYCSMFPEDYPMSRESLVRLWVAEGFAVRKEQSTPEEMAERYLRELIHRNMLEVVENDELGRVSTCKMHDIMRDLALSIAKEERFGSANDYGTMLLMDRKYVRRFSTRGWRDNSTPGVTFPCLRTLLSLEAISPSTNMLSSIMSESNYLTVMELQDSAITELPASVGNLFNLRYIGLRRTRVKSLPESIERLSYLNTLDIKQTKIEKLPRGLVKVKNLRHLFADRFVDEKQSEFRYFIGVQAPKGLSSLEELQTLETVEASKDLAEQLEKLMQLRSIWIDNIRATDCEKLFSALSKMPFLSSLLLSACDENEALCFQTLKPTSTKLHRLIVRGHWATKTLQCPIFQDHGKNLKYLALSWCQLGEDPLGVLASHVPNLTYLRLNNMHSAKTLVLSAGSFPHLKTIVLKHMPDVNQLKIMNGALLVVEGLYIQSLSGLARVPQGIETLHSLKKLWLRDLHQDFKAQWIENEMHQKMQHVPELRV